MRSQISLEVNWPPTLAMLEHAQPGIVDGLQRVERGDLDEISIERPLGADGSEWGTEIIVGLWTYPWSSTAPKDDLYPIEVESRFEWMTGGRESEIEELGAMIRDRSRTKSKERAEDDAADLLQHGWDIVGGDSYGVERVYRDRVHTLQHLVNVVYWRGDQFDHEVDLQRDAFLESLPWAKHPTKTEAKREALVVSYVAGHASLDRVVAFVREVAGRTDAPGIVAMLARLAQLPLPDDDRYEAHVLRVASEARAALRMGRPWSSGFARRLVGYLGVSAVAAGDEVRRHVVKSLLGIDAGDLVPRGVSDRGAFRNQRKAEAWLRGVLARTAVVTP